MNKTNISKRNALLLRINWKFLYKLKNHKVSTICAAVKLQYNREFSQNASVKSLTRTTWTTRTLDYNYCIL